MPTTTMQTATEQTWNYNLWKCTSCRSWTYAPACHLCKGTAINLGDLDLDLAKYTGGSL